MGSAWVEGGGGSRIYKARHPLIACGGGGGGASNRPCSKYTLMHADLSFSYLRFAEAASFNKKELRRSCTLPLFFFNNPLLDLTPRIFGCLNSKTQKIYSRVIIQTPCYKQ
jgi:hypothetical protein